MVVFVAVAVVHYVVATYRIVIGVGIGCAVHIGIVQTVLSTADFGKVRQTIALKTIHHLQSKVNCYTLSNGYGKRRVVTCRTITIVRPCSIGKIHTLG